MEAPETDPFSVELSCDPCPVGLFGTDGTNDDTSCPGTCPAGQSSSLGATSCQDCTPGKYSTAAGSNCTNCIAGKSSLQGKTLEADCTACEVGHYSNIGSACTTCVAGKQFVNAATECTICSKGKYRPSNAEGTAPCQNCLVGLYIEDDGSEAIEHESCKHCPKGYEIVGTDATKCSICSFSKVSLFFLNVHLLERCFTLTRCFGFCFLISHT